MTKKEMAEFQMQARRSKWGPKTPSTYTGETTLNGAPVISRNGKLSYAGGCSWRTKKEL